MNLSKTNKGFTLIELVVVIAVLAILFAITLVAINPARQFQNSRDTARRSDVNAILNAMHQYLAQPGITMPAGITTTAKTIRGLSTDPGFNAATMVDLCSLIVPTFVAAMPLDPTTGSGEVDCSDNYNTGYTIVRSATDNRLTITATPEVSGTTISVTR